MAFFCDFGKVETVLAPPAGGQVMGACENNWYPALQIILVPDWINITN